MNHSVLLFSAIWYHFQLTQYYWSNEKVKNMKAIGGITENALTEVKRQ